MRQLDGLLVARRFLFLLVWIDRFLGHSLDFILHSFSSHRWKHFSKIEFLQKDKVQLERSLMGKVGRDGRWVVFARMVSKR